MSTRRASSPMAAREAALQMLYALDLGGQSADRIGQWYLQAHPLDPEPAERACALLQAVVARQTELDALIERHSIGWKLARMNVVDRSLLRLATAELLLGVPAREVVPAAVKLARKFSQPDAVGFVQGLLEAIARERASEPEVTHHV